MYTDNRNTKKQSHNEQPWILRTSFNTFRQAMTGFAFLSLDTSLLIEACSAAYQIRTVSQFHITMTSWVGCSKENPSCDLTNCSFWPRSGLDGSQISQEIIKSFSLVGEKKDKYLLHGQEEVEEEIERDKKKKKYTKKDMALIYSKALAVLLV